MRFGFAPVSREGLGFRLLAATRLVGLLPLRQDKVYPMTDARMATLGDGGISERAKEFARGLPGELSYYARNMLADFVTRSRAQGTYIEDWLGEIAQELVDEGYLEALPGMTIGYGAPDEPYTLYAYTAKLLALRDDLP